MSWKQCRGRASVDKNQREIVHALRRCGFAVWEVNKEIDLIVSNPSDVWLMEIKNRDGYNRSTKAQEKFLEEWRGKPVIIAHDIEEALRGLGAIK